MQRLLAVLALSASLALGACGTNVGKFIDAATTTITNPVRSVDIYRVKNVYAASLEVAIKYRNYCWSKPYSELMADRVAKPVCQNRRQIMLALQAADAKAYAAIRSAENFVANNPTLNASSAISAAWAAVTNFQNLAASTAVRPTT